MITRAFELRLDSRLCGLLRRLEVVLCKREWEFFEISRAMDLLFVARPGFLTFTISHAL